MRRWLLLLLLFCVAASVYLPHRRKAFRTVAGGGADITENFEGTGYENSWTEVNGAPNEDQSTTGLSLEASQCLYITAEAGAEDTWVGFTATDTAYAYFLLRMEDLPTGSGRTQWRFANGTTTVLENACNIGPVQFHIFDGVSGDDVGAASISADTSLHIWFEYTIGTGANAIGRLYYSTDGTKPGTPECEFTNGGSTSQANRFYFGIDWSGTAGNIYYDKFRLSRTTAFGSNPP